MVIPGSIIDVITCRRKVVEEGVLGKQVLRVLVLFQEELIGLAKALVGPSAGVKHQLLESAARFAPDQASAGFVSADGLQACLHRWRSQGSVAKLKNRSRSADCVELLRVQLGL